MVLDKIGVNLNIKTMSTAVAERVSHNVRPTDKQRRAYDLLVENGGYKQDALRAAGYSDAVVKTPSKAIESKGFQQILKEQGILPDFLSKCLHDDIKAKPANRTRELELGFKLAGMLKDNNNAPTQALNVTNILNVITNYGTKVDRTIDDEDTL